MSTDSESKLLELLLATRDDGDEGARRELNAMLRADPAHRATIARLLVDEQALISRLRDDHMVAMLDAKPRPVPAKSPLKRRKADHSSWLAIAALLVFCGFLTWLALGARQGKKPEFSQQSAAALLKEAVDPVWDGNSPAVGSSLLPGTLKLQSGMASLEFASGARILLEGPAEIELISDMEASCRSGKLLANVPPPARGFAIATPSSRLVDLGTIFGVQVRDDGGTLVKVIQGKVELHHKESVLPMKSDSAAMVDAMGNATPVRANDAAFPSEENFNERISAGKRATATRWQSSTASLARDPSTLLLYNFQESAPTSRSVRNQAPNAPVESHGTLVGTGWTQGRWPGKHALEFNGRSDRMLFKLSGTSPATTCLAWLRVDSLPNLYNILLMPDTSKKSALQWMLLKSGEVRLALTNELADPASPRGWEAPVKAKAISNLDLGRWVFLASTYDSTTGEVIHYRDGQVIGTGVFPLGLPVAFDSYSFGNWADSSDGESTDAQSFRNFVGCLDEFAILSRALSPGEIERFYQSGKP